MINKFSLFSAFALFAVIAYAQEPAASTNLSTGLPPQASVGGYGPQEQAEHAAGLKRFLDAKFGTFIHFGLYSVPAGEWQGKTGYGEWFQIETQMPLAEYSKFAAQFNPTKFDAKEWVKNIKNAGIKYIVVTTKHHDGFAMYDTKLEDYNVVQQTPWHHDPMKDLAAACHDAGIMLCFYYSITDWHSPDFPPQYSQIWGGKGFHGNPNPNADMEKYVTYMKGQIREILTQYGPIGALWFDTGGAFHGLNGQQFAQLIHAQEIVDEVHQLQPGCMIDNRLGFGSDYDTPEQSIPRDRQSHPFEACMSLNNHWGYNKNDHNWKSPKTVVQDLVDAASKGGNYLTGIGAVADGTFPPPEAEPTLDVVGQWLKVNGESVYGTTASPLKVIPPWGCVTQNGNKLYLHVFAWPKDHQLSVPIQNEVKQAYLLTDPNHTPLNVTSSDLGTTIALLGTAPDSIDSVVVLEINDPSNVVTVDLDLAKNRPVEVSSTWPGREAEFNKSHITDGRAETSWAAEPTARTASVTIDLGADHDVSALLLCEPQCRTQAFNVEAQISGDWKKVVEGTTIGPALSLSFPSVKARQLRLNILKASDTPALSEFQIFEKPEPKSKTIHVFLIGGESNAGGSADLSGLPSPLKGPQNDILYFYNQDSRSNPMMGPIPLQPRLFRSEWGPEITFGQSIADYDKAQNGSIAILKYTKDRSNLYSQWAARNDATSDGPEYKNFQDTINTGLSALQIRYPGASVQIDGMIWMQGESDTDQSAHSSQYQANLTAFIVSIRKRYGADLPFVTGELSSAQTHVGNEKARGDVRAAQVAVAAALPHTGIVNTDSFSLNPDNVHFDAEGQQALGNAFASTLEGLLAAPKSSSVPPSNKQ